MSPPYCGLPRLSHQFPDVEVVVTFAVELVIIVAVVLIIAVVLVVEDEVAMIVDVAVVVLAQDAKTSDVNMRQVTSGQIAFLFIQTYNALPFRGLIGR